MGRVLGFTVPVHDVPGKPMGVSYPPGTREEDIPEEHLAQITNPKAWQAPDLDIAAGLGIDVEGGEQFPEHLEDCTNAQLRAIAERGDANGEPIPLGKLRSNKDIIELLRDGYGIDVKEDADNE